MGHQSLKHARRLDGQNEPCLCFKLEIFDVLGRKVKTLVDGPRRANNYKIIWDSRNDHGNAVASGVYFYRLKAGKYTKTRKMLLLK